SGFGPLSLGSNPGGVASFFASKSHFFKIFSHRFSALLLPSLTLEKHTKSIQTRFCRLFELKIQKIRQSFLSVGRIQLRM
ncbi:MAG: hypothetical protein WC082_01575, partial [Victivallales bacterium]